MPDISLRYAGRSAGGQILNCSVLFVWTREDFPHGQTMSASSGPKEYLKNDVCGILDRIPQADTVVLCRGNGPTFFIVRVGETWRDITGELLEVGI